MEAPYQWKHYTETEDGSWKLQSISPVISPVISPLMSLDASSTVSFPDALPKAQLLFGFFEEIGDRLWKLIQENSISDRLSSQVFHVLPVGALTPMALSGWKSENTLKTRVVLEDFVGDDIVDFTYHFHFGWDGRSRKPGKYLGSIHPVVDSLSVKALYEFNVEARALPALNIGTLSAPIPEAPIFIEMKLRDKFLGGETIRTDQHLLRGDGSSDSVIDE